MGVEVMVIVGGGTVKKKNENIISKNEYITCTYFEQQYSLLL